MTNLETVQKAYAAFGSGDVATLLSVFDPAIVWVNPGPAGLPYFGTHQGSDAVMRNVFGFLGENFQFEVFDPHTFFTSATQVVALLHMEAIVRRSGERLVQDTVHVFDFKAGKIARFQDFQNSYAMARALGA
jgi:ketosteroid isomerase-like protein